MFIQLKGNQADLYRQYLDDFRNKYHREPDAAARTEAYFCATNSNGWSRPYWCKA